MENILAIQLSAAEPGQILPWDGVAYADGQRAIMTVNQVLAKVQTTLFFGDSLYMIWYSIGTMKPQDGFSFFLKEFYNRPMPYAQLSQLPYASTPALYRKMVQTPPPAPPVATGNLTLLNSGFDPSKGYWVEFAGNYFLTMPLFQNTEGIQVVRDGPNYRGFQGQNGKKC